MTLSHDPISARQPTVDQRHWSARRSLAFVVATSIALWTLIIVALRALL